MNITNPGELYITRFSVMKDAQRTRVLLQEQGMPQRQNGRSWTPSRYE